MLLEAVHRLCEPPIPSVVGNHPTGNHRKVVLQSSVGMVGREEVEQHVVRVRVLWMSEADAASRGWSARWRL
jgi:hypothetical protein